MDKIYHLLWRVTCVIERSCEVLNDAGLFGPIEGDRDLEEEQIAVLGNEVNNANPNNAITSENTSTNKNEPMILGLQILCEWEGRRDKLEQDYSISN